MRPIRVVLLVVIIAGVNWLAFASPVDPDTIANFGAPIVSPPNASESNPAFQDYTDPGLFASAAGPLTTITFTEVSVGTVLSNQYPGVTFFDGDDFTLSDAAFIRDGVGAADGTSGPTSMTVVLSEPILAFGVHFPGAARISMYDVPGGTLLYQSAGFGGSGPGFFGGVVSTGVPFTTVVIDDWYLPPGYYDDLVFSRAGCEIDSDFNGTAHGWVSHSGDWYIGAEYLYTYGLAGAWSSASYVEDFEDFEYEARMWRSGCDPCSNSLVFRGTPDPLSPDNLWYSEYLAQYTRLGEYSVWRIVGQDAVPLVGWTFSPAINQGDAWNTLRVEASGTSLTFYINGTLLWSGTDSSLSSGRAGVGMYRDASSTGNELRVDWAYLCADQENILVLNDECSGSAQHFPAALANLGLDFTETTEDADFYAALTGGTAWDVVIVDAYGNSLAPATITELQSFIAAGGRLYVDYWGWASAPDLAAALEASVVSTYNSPITIYRWNASHPLFTTPNAVPDLAPSMDTCITDGARFNAVGDGVEVAGYTPAPTANQHAVIVGNGGRTVLYGGILGLFSGDNDSDGKSDGLEFAENVVNYLLPKPIFSDGFESGNTSAWSATVP